MSTRNHPISTPKSNYTDQNITNIAKSDLEVPEGELKISGTENNKPKSENKIYVGNLDPRVTEYHIINLFQPFGKIVKEEFAWHTYGAKKGEPRGFCFIEYATKDEATTARDKMNGKPVLGRPLTIHFSDEQVRTGPKSTTTQPLSIPDGPVKKQVSLSNEAMDAKIFAIKTKLRLMEKDGHETPVAISTSMRDSRMGGPASKRQRYEPYKMHKYP